jgi:stress-induced-phosphoprotein 1
MRLYARYFAFLWRLFFFQALKEKELGNAAYKKRDFETALAHYDKAISLDSTNVVFRNNKAGVPLLQ